MDLNLQIIKEMIRVQLLRNIDLLLQRREKEITSDKKFERGYCQAIQDVIKIIGEVL